MTDKTKLQSLFDAALKAPSAPSGSLQRAFPVSAPVPVAQPAAPVVTAAAEAPAEAPVAPMPVAHSLDAAAAEELGRLLDGQLLRKKRRRRIQALVTACIFFGSAGTGAVWFVQDASRVQAFMEAMRDIRSAGDVKSLAAKYRDALDRAAARGQQIDRATAAMGIKPSAGNDEDPCLESEMKDMMGRAGQRNHLLKQNFAHMEKENGGAPKPDPGALRALKEERSFDWGR